MKKYFIVALFICLFTSCYDIQDKARLQAECDALVSRKLSLNETIDKLNVVNRDTSVSSKSSKAHSLWIRLNTLKTK